MLLMLMMLVYQTGDAAPDTDKVNIHFKGDRNIRFEAKGRAGNLSLRSSAEEGQGNAIVDYQEGSGYIRFNREKQVFEWRTKTKFLFNRVAKNVEKKAPYLTATLPKGAELDIKIDINAMGVGTLNFRDLDISRIDMDIEFGDIDLSFPTENRSIVREWATFELRAGDLELYDLGNLKASQIKINGGMGEVTVDFGPKLFVHTEVRLDHDIGTAELWIPKGTRVQIHGTSRDFSELGFVKKEEQGYWEIQNYHPQSPLLDIKMSGPVGDLEINWK